MLGLVCPFVRPPARISSSLPQTKYFSWILSFIIKLIYFLFLQNSWFHRFFRKCLVNRWFLVDYFPKLQSKKHVFLVKVGRDVGLSRCVHDVTLWLGSAFDNSQSTIGLYPPPAHLLGLCTYLIFVIFLHRQNFCKIKFTPKFTQLIANLHSKLPIYTVNCQFIQ